MLTTAVIAASCDKGGDGPDPNPPSDEMMDVVVFTATAVTHIDGEEIEFRKICAMTPDGATKKVLHDGSAFDLKYKDASRAALDPTGSKLVLQGGDKFIWEYNLATKQHTTVIPETAGINVDDPSYSPDGWKILYANWASGDLLETVFANGTSRTTLTDDTYALGRQNYSPDGAKIVAANWLSGAYICTFNANGTGGRKILTASATESFDCPWPVSNTRIIYVHYAGAEKTGVCSIRSCNIDGTGGATLETLGECSVDYLTCNADGTQIGFYKTTASGSSYIVRPLTASSLGAVISTSSGGLRYRFGRIKKDIFDAAPVM